MAPRDVPGEGSWLKLRVQYLINIALDELSQGQGPAVCVLTSPTGKSDAHWNLRTTVWDYHEEFLSSRRASFLSRGFDWSFED